MAQRLLFSLTLMAAFGCASNITQDSDVRSHNLPEFVTAALNEEFENVLAKDLALVLRHELLWSYPELLMTQESFFREAEGQSPKLLEAAREFWNLNQAGSSIDSLGELLVNHVVVGKNWSKLDSSTMYSEWRDVRKENPGSPVITLSHPGFCSDGSVAVLYVSHSFGGLSGGGGFVAFEKQNGIWIKQDWHLGISWRG